MKNRIEFDYNPLLSQIAKGDEGAFSELYDMFAGSLTTHIVSKVSNSEVAEDILHDLFLSLWRNRKNMVDIESLPAYLYSSCRYLILAHYRKTLKSVDSLDLDNIDIVDENISLEDRLHYRYIIDMVTNEIENLPEKCKQVFKMSRHEFLTNIEIAHELGISESTVEKHINKAISRLRSVSKKMLFFF